VISDVESAVNLVITQERVEIEVGVHMSFVFELFLFFKINTWNVSYTVLLF
jgi:hypothetical protein